MSLRQSNSLNNENQKYEKLVEMIGNAFLENNPLFFLKKIHWKSIFKNFEQFEKI